LNEDIVKELVGDAHAIAELEKEWDQLSEDRLALRQIFPSGESKVTAVVFFCLKNCICVHWLDTVGWTLRRVCVCEEAHSNYLHRFLLGEP